VVACAGYEDLWAFFNHLATWGVGVDDLACVAALFSMVLEAKIIYAKVLFSWCVEMDITTLVGEGRGVSFFKIRNTYIIHCQS
jgi:hypothetical protein